MLLSLIMKLRCRSSNSLENFWDQMHAQLLSIHFHHVQPLFLVPQAALLHLTIYSIHGFPLGLTPLISHQIIFIFQMILSFHIQTTVTFPALLSQPHSLHTCYSTHTFQTPHLIVFVANSLNEAAKNT